MFNTRLASLARCRKSGSPILPGENKLRGKRGQHSCASARAFGISPTAYRPEQLTLPHYEDRLAKRELRKIARCARQVIFTRRHSPRRTAAAARNEVSAAPSSYAACARRMSPSPSYARPGIGNFGVRCIPGDGPVSRNLAAFVRAEQGCCKRQPIFFCAQQKACCGNLWRKAPPCFIGRQVPEESLRSILVAFRLPANRLQVCLSGGTRYEGCGPTRISDPVAIVFAFLLRQQSRASRVPKLRRYTSGLV